MVIDDSHRFFAHLIKSESHLRHVIHPLLHIAHTSHQCQHCFSFAATFYLIYALNSFTISGIASYSPYSVGGVEEHASLSKHIYSFLYFFFHNNKDSASRAKWKEKNVVFLLCISEAPPIL